MHTQLNNSTVIGAHWSEVDIRSLISARVERIRAELSQLDLTPEVSKCKPNARDLAPDLAERIFLLEACGYLVDLGTGEVFANE